MVGWTLCFTNPLGHFAVDNLTPVPAPSNIAPETNTNCSRYHNAEGGNDCDTLGIRYGISLKDCRLLNPIAWENCTNLWLEYSSCIVPVRSIDQYPGYDPPAPNFPITPESSTPIPFEDVFRDEDDMLVIPLANDSRDDCWDHLW